MSLESILQLLSCVSETRKETVRNGTGKVSSRLAAPPHLLVRTTILGVIAAESTECLTASSSQICCKLRPNNLESRDLFSHLPSDNWNNALVPQDHC